LEKRWEAARNGLLLFPVSRFTENLPLAAFLRAKAKSKSADYFWPPPTSFSRLNILRI
jgi:hypothetical protein